MSAFELHMCLDAIRFARQQMRDAANDPKCAKEHLVHTCGILFGMNQILQSTPVPEEVLVEAKAARDEAMSLRFGDLAAVAA